MCWRPEREGYGRAPNATDISYGSLRCRTDLGHVVSLPTTGPLYGTIGFELTTYMYGWFLCRKPRPQVQRSNKCTLRQWIQTLSRLIHVRRAWVYGGPILLYPESPRRYY